MTKEEYTYKQANDIGLEFSLKLKKLSKTLKKENEHFAKKGVVGFSKNREEYEAKLKEIFELYALINKPQVYEQIDKSSMEKIAADHKNFSKILEQYEINVSAAIEVGEMLFDITKENVGSSTREDMGYDKEAGLVSDKKILDNMPSVAVDSKV